MTLVGRLGTDPEVQQSANGTSFVKYSVGTSYGPKENRQTSWFRVANFSAEGSPQRDYVMGLGKGYVSNSPTTLKSWPALLEVEKGLAER
jgi:single-stranded DNA-binding protein